jgi:PhzF family phenazine biosynthesis protein
VLLALGRRAFGTYRQLSGTGVIEVRAFEAHGGIIEFRQTTPALDAPVMPTATLRVAEALRLPAALLHESLPARIARKGSTRLLLPVGDARALESLAPDFDSLISLGTELGADGFFVFCVKQDAGGIFTESRMFCPALGILEDPVSGNAHAMLAAYLWELGRLGNDTQTFVGHQGRWVNRPGRVSVRLEVSGGRLTAVHIGGGAVIVSEGVLL